MRSVVALLPLVLAVAACNSAPPSYENPPLAGKIDRQRIERDNCLLARAPQIDDRHSDIRSVARRVAAACTDETAKLLSMAVPYADDHARAGFQQEAERRAADIVLTFRRVDGGHLEERRVGDPTPLSK
ncbi:MAG TPA: hypothetical protein VEC60_16010 [Reyranella sp.]|nr:hypothetical protein [Reyranella sp.]